MELWVRSQKKGCLIKVNDLRIMQFDKDNFRILIDEEAVEGWNIVANDDPCIGTYKTKEKALEVLDEIQCHLVNINDSRDSYFYVYEMPKDEEDLNER